MRDSTDYKLMTQKRVLVIGSGLAAYGACVALLKNKSIHVSVFDVGLQKAYPGQSNIPVPNSVDLDGSYYPYGINDHRWPVINHSSRMCSSHALGGYSKVYSGSILKPQDEDLVDWPIESKPSLDDYNAIAENLRIWQITDEISEVFPCFPFQKARFTDKSTVLGRPRLALGRQKGLDLPFDCAYEFMNWKEQGLIEYQNDYYVTHMTRSNGQIRVGVVTPTGKIAVSFDQVYIGAGCVNTTAIVDRSLYGNGTRQYSIKTARSLLQLYLYLPLISYRKPKMESIKEIHNPDICRVFLEHRSTATGGLWSHTQINNFNRTILATIRRRLPPVLKELTLLIQGLFRFSITVFHSNLGDDALLTSSIKASDANDWLQEISILEKDSICSRKLASTTRSAIRSKFFRLRLIPVPFGQLLADVMRGNRLGGWHYGGTLARLDNPTEPVHLTPRGELFGMKHVYVVDAAGFPSIPGSTVALLTMANAFRIAKTATSDLDPT